MLDLIPPAHLTPTELKFYTMAVLGCLIALAFFAILSATRSEP